MRTLAEDDGRIYVGKVTGVDTGLISFSSNRTSILSMFWIELKIAMYVSLFAKYPSNDLKFVVRNTVNELFYDVIILTC